MSKTLIISDFYEKKLKIECFQDLENVLQFNMINPLYILSDYNTDKLKSWKQTLIDHINEIMETNKSIVIYDNLNSKNYKNLSEDELLSLIKSAVDFLKTNFPKIDLKIFLNDKNDKLIYEYKDASLIELKKESNDYTTTLLLTLLLLL
jgi:hypothetical protein